MKISATTVDDYLAGVPDSRRAALTTLRKLCVKCLKGYEEVMAYGGPCYRKNGVIEVGFASQKHFLALYVLKKDLVNSFRERLTGASIGKGCIRYTKPEKIDFHLIEKLLVATSRSREIPC